MIDNEGLYTTLTWMQLWIGVSFGVVAVFVINAIEQMRRKLQAGKGEEPIPAANQSPEAEAVRAAKRADLPGNVVSIMRATYYSLRVLATSRKPLFLGSLVRRVHAAQRARRERDLLTPVAIRAALDRLVSHENVRLGRHGMSITASGSELFVRVARINEKAVPERAASTPFQLPAFEQLNQMVPLSR
ncbi:MAG: hypothetical protein EOP84_17715 [Verrucomicrobiaceae bacterium]|nr:MAG: hypothetical protein EOP84_17715 [Verrucomicrobiaceae bacterium]